MSPACWFCYADRDAQRYGHQVWRRHGPRRMLSEANWQRPFRWNRDAERAGVPAKVFCASMADVFEDHPDVAARRERLWGLIEATPWLIWQLLTKRPENIARMVPWGGEWPPHVWVGTSVENQRYAGERIPILVSAAARARIRFLSCEPLLGTVDLSPWLFPGSGGNCSSLCRTSKSFVLASLRALTWTCGFAAARPADLYFPVRLGDEALCLEDLAQPVDRSRWGRRLPPPPAWFR